MARFVMRVLVPSRVRRAVLGRFDARYVKRADHRQDVRDSLWEVQALKRELVALRREVDQLRRRVDGAGMSRADPALVAKVEDAHRLATETASAVDGLSQSDVLLWQAVDALSEGDRALSGRGRVPGELDRVPGGRDGVRGELDGPPGERDGVRGE